MRRGNERLVKPNISLAKNIEFDAYDATPLESFGLNILMKFGPKESSAGTSSSSLGNKRRAPDKLIENKPRNHRAGLGCDITTIRKANHKSNGKKRNCYGAKVIIIGGSHEGLEGKITERITSDDVEGFLKQSKYVSIQLNNCKESIQIKSKYLQLSAKPEEDNDKADHDDPITESDEKSESPPQLGLVEREKLEWIQQGLIVRIVNKASPYYNTKVKVEDVIDDSTFSIITSDNVLHSDFNEKDCETVIPAVNSDVIVLSAEVKGLTGKLIERNKKENKVLVQLYDDLTIIELTQDDICSFNK